MAFIGNQEIRFIFLNFLSSLTYILATIYKLKTLFILN
jgi:hypothetical protein